MFTRICESVVNVPIETFEVTSMLYEYQSFSLPLCRGLPFCDRLNIKPYPRFDLSSRTCYNRFTIHQFFWVLISGINLNAIGIAFVLNQLVEIGLGREHHLPNNGIAHEIYWTLFVSNRRIFYVRWRWALSVDLVGWKKHPCNSRRHWRSSKMVRAIKKSVLRHCSTDTSNTSSLLKKESVGFSLQDPKKSRKIIKFKIHWVFRRDLEHLFYNIL